MRKLRCHTTGLNNTIFAKITHSHQKRKLRSDYVFVASEEKARNYNGYAAVIVEESQAQIYSRKLTGIPLIIMQDKFVELNDNDVVQVSPQSHTLLVPYESQSPHNGLFLTERCNSRCIMCPQRPRPDSEDRVGYCNRLIELIAPSLENLTLTGGEPTLLGDKLIELIVNCREKLPHTKLMLLTNGRKLKDIDFVDKLAEASRGYLAVAVPIYADTDSEHDKIVGISGAFEEALRGCTNLALYGFHVEVRVVIMAQNYMRLPPIADFIYRNLTFTSHVALMGLEVHDLAEDNFDQVWVDPFAYQKELLEACKFLFRRSIPVSIYNHQLCVMPKELWPLSRKSISDWKNIYLPICSRCQKKGICGGFFATSSGKYSNYVKPIKNEKIV